MSAPTRLGLLVARRGATDFAVYTIDTDRMDDCPNCRCAVIHEDSVTVILGPLDRIMSPDFRRRVIGAQSRGREHGPVDSMRVVALPDGQVFV